jgi:hypothetical protein
VFGAKEMAFADSFLALPILADIVAESFARGSWRGFIFSDEVRAIFSRPLQTIFVHLQMLLAGCLMPGYAKLGIRGVIDKTVCIDPMAHPVDALRG